MTHGILNPHLAFGELVKLLSAPVGRCRTELFLLNWQLEGISHPKYHTNKKAHGRAMSFFVGTV